MNIDQLKTSHDFSQTAFRYHHPYEYLPFKCCTFSGESKQNTTVAMKPWIVFHCRHGEIDFEGVKSAQLSPRPKGRAMGFRCLRRCRSNSELSRRLETASFCRCGSDGKLLTLLLMDYCFP